MPIVQLQPEQINQLREAVITTFLVRTNKKTFQYTTFKDKYIEIQKDIYVHTGINATEVSVGLVRLRKFFYYTNPDVCKPHQLQVPSFGKDFIDALQLYSSVKVLNPLVSTPEKSTSLEPSSASFLLPKTVKLENYPLITTYCGALLGFITALITTVFILFNGYNGYPNPEWMPIIFLVHVVLGGLTGWICGSAIIKGGKRTILQQISLFVLSFCFFCLMRQAAVRNALVSPSERGGPLGYPDFEMLATAGACASGLVMIISFLLREEWWSSQKIIFFTIKTALITGIVFASVFMLYRILEINHFIIKNDVIIAPVFFKFSFPHPERIFLVVPLGATFTYCLLRVILWLKQ